MSKKTLNKANLEALGAEQLASLLLEVSQGSADIKRRLRLELSHTLGPAELARDVRKRLVSLRKSRSFVSWRKRKALIKDLSTQAAMITGKIAPEDPAEAFHLLWEFISLAPGIQGRVDDSRGEVADVFRTATAQIGQIAAEAGIAPAALADLVWAAVQDNAHGEWDGIIPIMAPALGQTGLVILKDKAQAFAATPLQPAANEPEAIRFLRDLRGGADHTAERKARFVKWCLQEIALAMGDTPAYIAQFSDQDLRRKDIASEVAMLLLPEARASEALTLLQDADQDGRGFGQDAWDAAYVACLIALDRAEQAQAHRWACFEATLNAGYLRDYLKVLPDFDDVEAEDRAKAHALRFPDAAAALAFCLNWPDLLAAAHLVETRLDAFDGDAYALLAPAAEALRPRYPLAAVLLWRRMIDHTLGHARSSRYDHAADHLADCAALDAEITDYGAFPDHDRYQKALRTRHDRKASFWAKMR